MSSYNECAQCGIAVLGNTWSPGQACVMGMIFCCSRACAETWAKANVAIPWKVVERDDGCIEIKPDMEGR